MKKFIHRDDVGDFEIPDRVEKDRQEILFDP
jgi:hypothetical protein